MNREKNEQDEVDGTKKGTDSTGNRRLHMADTAAYLNERLVVCNDEDTDGLARVTTDEERILHVD